MILNNYYQMKIIARYSTYVKIIKYIILSFLVDIDSLFWTECIQSFRVMLPCSSIEINFRSTNLFLTVREITPYLRAVTPVRI